MEYRLKHVINVAKSRLARKLSVKRGRGEELKPGGGGGGAGKGKNETRSARTF